MRELLTRRRWIEIARIAVAGVAPLPVLLGAGTLTMGRPEVGRIQVLDPSVTEDVVLRLAAAAERRSSHFFADAVIAAAKSRKLEVAEPADFEVVRGRGVRATVDVGIAMGAAGSEAAMEAADIALMTDDVSKIFEARVYRTIKENLFVGVRAVDVAGIAAAHRGLIGPIQAAMIHLGVLVFVNSKKLLRVRLPGVTDAAREGRA